VWLDDFKLIGFVVMECREFILFDVVLVNEFYVFIYFVFVFGDLVEVDGCFLFVIFNNFFDREGKFLYVFVSDYEEVWCLVMCCLVLVWLFVV